MRQEYNVKITEISKDSLSKKEQVLLKDLSNAIMINDKSKEGNFEIHPDYWAVLDVHNEQSEDKDYTKFIIVDKDGTKYQTGSESFWNSFKDIVTEMGGSDEEYGILVYRKPSANRNGQEFITCSII